jgi:hypothetical protein
VGNSKKKDNYLKKQKGGESSKYFFQNWVLFGTGILVLFFGRWDFQKIKKLFS